MKFIIVLLAFLCLSCSNKDKENGKVTGNYNRQIVKPDSILLVDGCIIKRVYNAMSDQRLLFYVNSYGEILSINKNILFDKAKAGDSVTIQYSYKNEDEFYFKPKIIFHDLKVIGKCSKYLDVEVVIPRPYTRY